MINKKRKKLMLVLAGLISLFLINSVLAVWVLTIQTTGIYTITSNEDEFGFTTQFTEISIDGTDDRDGSSIIPLDTAIINNPGEDKYVSVDIEIIKTDVADYCVDFEDDCTLNFKAKLPSYYENNALVMGETINLFDGANFLLRTGNAELQNYMTCKPNSCSQEISATITLIPN